MKPSYHTPALGAQVIEYLAPRKGGIYVDATLGGGGHSILILKETKGGASVIAIDRDREAIEEAKDVLKEYEKRVKFVNDNFINLRNILKTLKIKKIDGILFDLGVSSHQIDDAERGFSLRSEGPLDMRMDKGQSLTAKEIVNSWQAKDIEKIIRELGEERLALRIARGIVSARPITTTLELKNAIEDALSGLPPKVKFDAVTRTFQALRIAVNDELESLKCALRDAVDLLKKKGRVVVISYHSLEDRIVKTIFREASLQCVCPKSSPICTCSHKKELNILTKKPVTPATSEIAENPRSRSAKLRAGERV